MEPDLYIVGIATRNTDQKDFSKKMKKASKISAFYKNLLLFLFINKQQHA
jgi:hypothetical protein